MDYYEQYKGLIHHVIENNFKSYMRTMYDDMFSTGTVALLYGIKKYDASKDASMKTFLYKCIKNAIQGTINKETFMSAQQCRITQLSSYIYNKIIELENKVIVDKDIYDMVYELCIKDERFKHLTKYNYLCAWNIAKNYFIQTVTPDKNDDDAYYYEVASPDPSPEDIVIEGDLVNSIMSFVKQRFSKAKSDIFLDYINNIVNDEGLTLEEIAIKHGTSRQYVSKVVLDIKKYLNRNRGELL